jgi:membrane-associated phospholipid phosphatase
LIQAPLLLAALLTVAQHAGSPAPAVADDGVDADGDGFIDATQTGPPPAVPETSAPPPTTSTTTTTTSTTPAPASPPPTTTTPVPASSTPTSLPLPAMTSPSEPTPSTPGFPPPSPEQQGIVVHPSTSPPPAPDGFSPGQPGGYLVWYGVDYAALAVAGGLYASGVTRDVVPAPALLGPRFDLDKADLAVLFDPRLDDVIGKPLVKEKVPSSALLGASAGVLLGTALVDHVAGGDWHRTHALVLGGAEAMVGTLVVTEALKLSFGRLRPDFRERWLRAACAGNVDAPDGLDCSGVDDGFVVSRGDVIDGMKSFPSGHSSTSFALLSYATLAIGSRWIWRDDVPWWTPPVASLVVGAIGVGAGFTAASRLSDDRHHPEDVVVGAALGTAIGASTWLLHFDRQGRARTRWPVTVVPTTTTGPGGAGTGVAVVGSFG